MKNRLSYWLVNYWVEFDNNYMKKRLIHDWPNCKIQNNELSEKITDLADEYVEEYKKREENKSNIARNLNDNNIIDDFELKQFSQGNNARSNMKVAFSEKNFENYSPNNRRGKINFLFYIYLDPPKSPRSNFSGKSGNSQSKIKNVENLKIDL